MLVRNWIDGLKSRLTRSRTRRARRASGQRGLATRRLTLEGLEDRRLLAFLPTVDYAVGTNPQAVVTADFNGDGRLDLATANNSTSNVSVLLGNANGTFQPAQNSATGTYPQSVAVGDFNADGKLDLVTANASDVSLLLGKGNGTFQAPINIAISNPASMAVGDFNADGKLDLGVTSNFYFPGDCWYGCYPGYYEGRANVLLGNGAGSFSTPSVTSLGYGIHTSTVVADFNADGKRDFAAGSPESSSVAVLLGTVTGLGDVNFFSAGSSWSMAAGDVNGDGKLDLVSANLDDYYSVLLGTGLGTFGAAQYLPVGSAANSLAVADFNGDSKIDLVTANGNTGTVSLLLGTGTGSFKPPVDAANAAGPVGVAVGDFNGDGRMDVATANANSNKVSVLLNDGIWPALGAPSITIGDAAVTEGNVGTTSVVFTVSLSAAYNQTVSVHYATTDGSATLAGGDYQSKSGTVTFAAGVTSQTVTVLVNSDRLAENGETFSVRLTNSTNSFVADAMAVGTILDDEPFIGIASEVSSVEGNAGTTAFNFNITLSAPYDAPVSVDFATSDLSDDWVSYGYASATAGVDYAAKSGTLTFAAGETSATVTVLVNGDRVGEPYEYFFLRLSNPRGGQLISSQVLGTIVDDEPVIDFIYSYESVMEGNTGTTPVTFTVTLSAPYDAPVTVDYATSDLTDDWVWYYGTSATTGSDYVAKSGKLTFAAGQTSQTITVLVNGDRLGEPYEYFFVNLSNSNGAQLNSAQVLGTIQDDEPHIRFNDGVSIVEGNTGTKAFTFTVSLSAVNDAPVIVSFATADGSALAGSDYVAASGTLTFAPGQASLPISVTVKGDVLSEIDEYFFVNLSGAVNGLIDYASGYGTILDDDAPPSIDIGEASVVEGNSGTKLMTFTVTLSHASDKEVRVKYATANDTAKTSDKDYVAKSGTISFAAGETSKTIAVTVTGDKKKEKDEYFSVRLSSATNGVIANSWGYGTIINDDTPPSIRISDASVVEGTSGTKVMSFTVSLSQASGSEVRVNFATDNGTAKTSDNDYVSKSGTLTFAPGETTKTITVNIKGDKKKENDEYFYVKLSGASNGTIADSQGIGTILDDDN